MMATYSGSGDHGAIVLEYLAGPDINDNDERGEKSHNYDSKERVVTDINDNVATEFNNDERGEKSHNHDSKERVVTDFNDNVATEINVEDDSDDDGLVVNDNDNFEGFAPQLGAVSGGGSLDLYCPGLAPGFSQLSYGPLPLVEQPQQSIPMVHGSVGKKAMDTGDKEAGNPSNAGRACNSVDESDYVLQSQRPDAPPQVQVQYKVLLKVGSVNRARAEGMLNQVGVPMRAYKTDSISQLALV